MPQNLKNVIVVLFIGAVIFRMTKPVMLMYSAEIDLLRRQRVWYLLTGAAFLAPSAWLYGAIAVPLLISASRKDSNPAAIYLLVLHVTPGISISVPLIGSLSTQFMLTISIIVPAIMRLVNVRYSARIRGMQSVDWILLGYIILSSALYIHQLGPDGRFFPSTPIDFFRRLFFSCISIFFPYFLISRSTCNRQAIVDAVAALWLSVVLMAAIALFEEWRGWLLYDLVSSNWGANRGVFLMRGGSLRAMASSGHPLSLGYLLAIGFGIWLYLQRAVQAKAVRFAFGALLWMGQIAAYSRGPWICAVLIVFLFAAQKPGAAASVGKTLLGAVIAATIVAVSPLGPKIAGVLPFLGGNVDSGNIEYRQRLWDRGWEVIWQNPLLGDQYAMIKLQDLRQGEGIIDFVNGYISELLSTGFIGLSLFLAVTLIVMVSAWKSSRRIRPIDEEFSYLGGSLISCILGTLFLWAFGGPDSNVLWPLVALASAFAFIGLRENLGSVNGVSQASSQILHFGGSRQP